MPGLFFFHYLVHTLVYWLHDCFIESKMLWIVQSSHFGNHLCYQLKDNGAFLSLRIFILYLKNSYLIYKFRVFITHSWTCMKKKVNKWAEIFPNLVHLQFDFPGYLPI